MKASLICAAVTGLIGIWAPLHPSQAEDSERNSTAEIREFTNARGDTMEARFLGKEGDIAVLQRVSNGNVVRIPVTQLSLDDQLWIREKQRREERTSPDKHGWHLVRIEVENPMDTPTVVGLFQTLTSVGDVEWDAVIPVDCWIEFRFLRSGNVNSMDQQYFLKYRGERKLKVKCDGQFGWVSRDGSEFRAFGMSVRSRGSLEKVRVDVEKVKDRVGEGLSLTTNRADALTEVLRTRVPVTAVSLDDGLKLSEVAVPVEKLGVKVLSHLALAGDDLEILGMIESLEGLHIGSSFRNPNPVDWEGLKHLVGLKSLTALLLKPRSEPYSLGCLEGAENLRWLNVSGTNLIDDRLPYFSRLESLLLSSGRFDPAAIARMKNLRVLFVGPANLGARGEALASLPRLRVLDIAGGHYQRDEEPIEEDAMRSLGEKGIFSGVYRLNTNIDLDYRHFPSLRKVGLRNPKGIRLDLARLKNGPELDFLELEDPTNEDLELIASMPALRRLRTLSFLGGHCDKFEVLSSLSELQNLQIRSTSLPVEELDVSAFPALVKLDVMSGSFHRIEGIAGHPTLAKVYLAYCRNLETLGESAPNTALKSLQIHNSLSFKNLDALSQAESLEWLAYYNNGESIKPLPLHPSAGRLYRYINFETPDHLVKPAPAE